MFNSLLKRIFEKETPLNETQHQELKECLDSIKAGHSKLEDFPKLVQNRIKRMMK